MFNLEAGRFSTCTQPHAAQLEADHNGPRRALQNGIIKRMQLNGVYKAGTHNQLADAKTFTRVSSY